MNINQHQVFIHRAGFREERSDNVVSRQNEGKKKIRWSFYVFEHENATETKIVNFFSDELQEEDVASLFE